MEINKVSGVNASQKVLPKKKQEISLKNNTGTSSPYLANVSSSAIRANYAPLSFTGNANAIKEAYIITGEEEDVPLLVTKKNGSYVIDFDSQTEIIYGEDAVKYLQDKTFFEYDTQVIFPKKSSGKLYTDDGKTVILPENSAATINAKSNGRVVVDEGYPMVVVTKKDYDWYERYKRDAQDENIRNKFLELIYYNSHLYNGHFTPNSLLPERLKDEEFLQTLGIDKYQSRNNLVYDLYAKRYELSEQDRDEVMFARAIVEKLKETGAAYDRPDGYLKFSTLYNPDFQANYLKENGFTQKQIEAVMPIYKKSRQAHMDARFSLKNPASDYPYELVEKMKEAGIIHNNKKLAGEFIYWKETFANETDIRNKLGEKGFEPWEVELIVDNWRKYNLTGFDLSGLKHISPKMAVYGFSDKLNNWTQEATNWITNSTAPTSSEGITPFVGVSMVQMDEDEIVPMSKIRSEEKLHAHPNLEEKRQTEIYLITSGAAALNVVKGGKSQVKILREGELAVVGPGVLHSINSISGEYEHIVSQVPSAFQYGFGFKQIVEPPQDYDEERLGQEAFEQLSECRNS